MQFMKPEIYRGGYFKVNTSAGTEIVPADGVAMTVHVTALLTSLIGRPDDPAELITAREGWLARMSAPGYLDCTDWTAHPSKSAAEQYLVEAYGPDDE